MISKIRRLPERWMRFWFEPTEPLNLGVCRILFFGAFFLFYFRTDFSLWGEVSNAFWMPISFFKTFHVQALPSGLLSMLQIVWKVSLALSCLGLFTRASTFSSFVFGMYLLGLPQNFGKINHYDALVVIVLGIMALSRCGDAYSLDRLIGRMRQGGGPSARGWRVSGEYTWPVRTVWLTFALIFFAAGTSKLRHSGLDWIFSDNMQILLIEGNHHFFGADPLVPWGLYIARYGWLTRLLAAGSIGLEVSYPLTLYSRRARWIIVPSVFLMQVGIKVLMGPSFDQFLICNLFWVPWDRVIGEPRLVFARLRQSRDHAVPRNMDTSKRPRQ